MKKVIFVVILVLTIIYSFGNDFVSCRLIFSDSTILIGYAKMPNMMDKYVTFMGFDNETKKIYSDKLVCMIFSKENDTICYQRVLTYKNYANKKVDKRKSWLKVLKSGYMNLYYGFQPGTNSPSINMWYCKKANDSIAYFISMKYSGGLVFTVGTNNSFEKNASIYFNDYTELSTNILKGKYKFDDLELIVDEYNKWKEDNINSIKE